MFELTNRHREYLGLDLVDSKWERKDLKAGPYQPASLLYYEGNTIKKQIVSTENRYYECQLNLETKNKEILLPKTSRGKEKKLTAAVLEKAKPDGISFEWTINGTVFITNHNTQINFYSNFNEDFRIESITELDKWLGKYIEESSPNYLDELSHFKKSTRLNIKYKAGDFFAFKISRYEYGFGRILLDINKIRKKNLIPKEHGLQLIMGPPLLIKIYAFTSDNLDVDLDQLSKEPSLPSDYIMDNHIFYGEYPVIGNRILSKDDYEFPISFGRSIDFKRSIIFLQWGFIHLEKPLGSFDKYLIDNDNKNLGNHNPHGYYGNGFYHRYSSKDILNAELKGNYDFESGHFKDKNDLRNPLNKTKLEEIFEHFNLDTQKSYWLNCDNLNINALIK